MTTTSYSIEPQTPADEPAIEALLDLAFGLSRRTKTSYRFREGETAVPGLSFVARHDAVPLAGTISFWRLIIGEQRAPALLLGPLAVHPSLNNLGIGRTLMEKGIALARFRGEGLILLVGDEPYYGRVGFRPVPEGQLIFPGPVDPKRLLFLELKPGALEEAQGLVLPPGRVKAARVGESAASAAFAVPHQAH
ncbi:MAG: N-acetyltransferase [Hyphomicrobiales bacterium]